MNFGAKNKKSYIMVEFIEWREKQRRKDKEYCQRSVRVDSFHPILTPVLQPRWPSPRCRSDQTEDSCPCCRCQWCPSKCAAQSNGPTRRKSCKCSEKSRDALFDHLQQWKPKKVNLKTFFNFHRRNGRRSVIPNEKKKHSKGSILCIKLTCRRNPKSN